MATKEYTTRQCGECDEITLFYARFCAWCGFDSQANGEQAGQAASIQRYRCEKCDAAYDYTVDDIKERRQYAGWDNFHRSGKCIAMCDRKKGECVEPQADAPMLQFKCPDHGIFEATGYDNPVFLADTIANCPQCNEKCWQPTDAKLTNPAYDYISHDKPDTSLSLLIIDLGNCCVVRVETGSIILANWHDTELTAGGACMCPDTTFEQAKRYVEDMGKPVPRIERFEDFVQIHFAPMNSERMDCETVTHRTFDALCEIAGHPLKVWDGNGEWKCLNGIDLDEMPTVWRYVRRA